MSDDCHRIDTMNLLHLFGLMTIVISFTCLTVDSAPSKKRTTRVPPFRNNTRVKTTPSLLDRVNSNGRSAVIVLVVLLASTIIVALICCASLCHCQACKQKVRTDQFKKFMVRYAIKSDSVTMANVDTIQPRSEIEKIRSFYQDRLKRHSAGLHYNKPKFEDVARNLIIQDRIKSDWNPKLIEPFLVGSYYSGFGSIKSKKNWGNVYKVGDYRITKENASELNRKLRLELSQYPKSESNSEINQVKRTALAVSYQVGIRSKDTSLVNSV